MRKCLADKDLVQIGGETHKLDSSVPPVLVPSCRDIAIDGCNCILARLRMCVEMETFIPSFVTPCRRRRPSWTRPHG
jgi:hypothetical protein